MTSFTVFNSLSLTIISSVIQFLLGYVIIKKVSIPENFPLLKSFLFFSQIIDLTTQFLWIYKINNWRIMVVYMIVEYLFLLYLMYSWLPPGKQKKLRIVLIPLAIISVGFSVYSFNNIFIIVWVNGARFFQLLGISIYVLFWYIKAGPNEGVFSPVPVMLCGIIIFSGVGSLIVAVLGIFRLNIPYNFLTLFSNLLYCCFAYSLIKFIMQHKKNAKLGGYSGKIMY